VQALGTAGTWFLFDVLFAEILSFNPLSLEAAAFGGINPLHLLQRTAVDSRSDPVLPYQATP
jgi:hypothetical protein